MCCGEGIERLGADVLCQCHFNVSLVSSAGKCVGVQAYAGLPSEWLEFKMAGHMSWACALKTMPLFLSHSLSLSITVAFFIILFPILFALGCPLCHFHCDRERSWVLCCKNLSGIRISTYCYWEAFRCIENHSGNSYFMIKLLGLKRWMSEQCSCSDWHVHYSKSVFQQPHLFHYGIKHKENLWVTEHWSV